MILPRKYPYNPRLMTIFAITIMGGSVSLIFGTLAMQLTFKSMTIDGPAIFAWAQAILLAVGTLLWTNLMVRRRCNPKVLKLDEDAIVLPHGFLQGETTRISYSDIQRVWETRSRMTWTNIATRYGTFCLGESLMPDRESYNAVRDFLISRASLFSKR